MSVSLPVNNDDLRAALTSVCPAITLAIVFGSMANNTATFHSDLDVAVYADRALLAEEKKALIEALAFVTGRSVDLIDLHSAGEPLLGQILTKGRRIFGDNTCFAKLLSRHWFEQADFLPYKNRILKERREKWIGN